MWSETDKFSESLQLSPEVINAIKQVIPKSSSGGVDEVDFDVITYINTSFPTEQSLSGLNDVISSIESEIVDIDGSIREFVRDQTGTSTSDGLSTLARAQASIETLVAKVMDMKGRAEQSEIAVRDMTRDIRQLDTAKRNLTTAITTLNHLNMLVSGVDTLQSLVERRQYVNTANLLQGVANVVEHFDKYNNIPQISLLSQKVSDIKRELGEVISLEFRESFSPSSPSLNGGQMREACLVLDVLHPSIKSSLLTWLISSQLKEYSLLFHETEDSAWIDKIDKRFSWLKKHLIQFEERYSPIFPPHWSLPERLAVEFCSLTRDSLAKVMGRRRSDIDTKLLLGAIAKTVAFENLLHLRFGSSSTGGGGGGGGDEGNPFLNSGDETNPFLSQNSDPPSPSPQSSKQITNKFHRIITQCFDPFLYIYIESQDKNLGELLEKFINELRMDGFPTPQGPDATAIVFSNCADLFVFYKKCLVQCTQLSCGEPLLSLADVFSKRLKEYSTRILSANLPKVSMTSGGLSSVSVLTRELRDLSTSALISNFHSLLKEGETVRFSRHELYRISCILTTAEYCVETTSQLEDKLREKLEGNLGIKCSMESEKRGFSEVIETCVGLLVQDLSSACDPVLLSMNKTNWSSVETVGDQSSYISAITSQWRLTVPTLRDFLGTSRKYFVQFCQQFAKIFMSKFISTLYKFKNISKMGAQQLLLDTQSLKTSLLDLPSIGLTVKRKPPDKYSKLIVKDMGRVELVLKIIMSPPEESSFIDHFLKLLPDSDLSEFSKILEMKGAKKSDINSLVEEFKFKAPSRTNIEGGENNLNNSTSSAATPEFSRIKKLEKLIKKRL